MLWYSYHFEEANFTLEQFRSLEEVFSFHNGEFFRKKLYAYSLSELKRFYNEFRESRSKILKCKTQTDCVNSLVSLLTSTTSSFENREIELENLQKGYLIQDNSKKWLKLICGGKEYYLPHDLALHIFSFMNHDLKSLNNMLPVSEYFYNTYLDSWDNSPLKIDMKYGSGRIPLLARKSANRLHLINPKTGNLNYVKNILTDKLLRDIESLKLESITLCYVQKILKRCYQEQCRLPNCENLAFDFSNGVPRSHIDYKLPLNLKMFPKLKHLALTARRICRDDVSHDFDYIDLKNSIPLLQKITHLSLFQTHKPFEHGGKSQIYQQNVIAPKLFPLTFLANVPQLKTLVLRLGSPRETNSPIVRLTDRWGGIPPLRGVRNIRVEMNGIKLDNNEINNVIGPILELENQLKLLPDIENINAQLISPFCNAIVKRVNHIKENKDFRVQFDLNKKGRLSIVILIRKWRPTAPSLIPQFHSRNTQPILVRNHENFSEFLTTEIPPKMPLFVTPFIPEAEIKKPQDFYEFLQNDSNIGDAEIRMENNDQNSDQGHEQNRFSGDFFDTVNFNESENIEDLIPNREADLNFYGGDLVAFFNIMETEPFDISENNTTSDQDMFEDYFDDFDNINTPL